MKFLWKLFHRHNWLYEDQRRACLCGKFQRGLLINNGMKKMYFDEPKVNV